MKNFIEQRIRSHSRLWSKATIKLTNGIRFIFRLSKSEDFWWAIECEFLWRFNANWMKDLVGAWSSPTPSFRIWMNLFIDVNFCRVHNFHSVQLFDSLIHNFFFYDCINILSPLTHCELRICGRYDDNVGGSVKYMYTTEILCMWLTAMIWMYNM